MNGLAQHLENSISLIKTLEFIYFTKNPYSQAGDVISAHWEAEAGRLQGQQFETNLANMMKTCLY